MTECLHCCVIVAYPSRATYRLACMHCGDVVDTDGPHPFNRHHAFRVAGPRGPWGFEIPPTPSGQMRAVRVRHIMLVDSPKDCPHPVNCLLIEPRGTVCRVCTGVHENSDGIAMEVSK